MRWGIGYISAFNPIKHRFVAAFGKSPTIIPSMPLMAPGAWSKFYAGDIHTSERDGWHMTVAEADTIIEFRMCFN